VRFQAWQLNGLKVMDPNRYLEQWERVQRWYSKVEEFSLHPSAIKQDDALDIVYAFFTNCFHLKDWIKASHPELKNEVEDLFDDKKGKPCFNICAGLANGSKHLSPDTNKRPTYGNASVVVQNVRLYVPTLSLNNQSNAKLIVKASYSWSLNSSGMQYDVYELAKECMEEWGSYLKNRNLV
jgi:hypothetical protein